ncbi:MAG: pyridoxamine 5'-phosphate oxidase family protein [Nanoarchaeota archaeon]|nr:pyridoxamine 5'-phosphate oxidase family protein [Nanoarchaeota archaeon]MCG2717954.1 pyridoxamine 5'-phosphate oxidase family protein [Nanoarchaeota archaeon]
MVEINKEIKKLVEGNALGLATIDHENKPHCIAVGYVKVVSEDQILITDNYMAETVKNIQKNNNVSLAVWSRNWKEDCKGYELKGTAEYFSDGEWYDKVKAIPENDGETCKGAILIRINKIKKLA